MPVYESDLYSPPAPVARVTLRNPESGLRLADVPLIIDSGADVTLLPRAVIEFMGIAIDTETNYELRGVDDIITYSPAVYAEVVFAQTTFRGEYLLMEQEVGLLGRDILKHVSLLLDGPHLVWEIQ